MLQNFPSARESMSNDEIVLSLRDTITFRLRQGRVEAEGVAGTRKGRCDRYAGRKSISCDQRSHRRRAHRDPGISFELGPFRRTGQPGGELSCRAGRAS